MGLLDKIPFPRTQREFFERLFSPTDGHRHDGVDSRKVPLDAALVPDDSIGTDKLRDLAVTSEKMAAAAVGSAQIADGTIGDSKLMPHLIQTRATTLDFADITSMHTAGSEIELVPAPGADHFIQVVSMMLFLDQNDEVFADDRTLDIGYDDASVSILEAAIPATFHQAAADRVFVAQVVDALEHPAADVVDQNIAITASGEIGGNASETSTIYVDVVYRILQV